MGTKLATMHPMSVSGDSQLLTQKGQMTRNRIIDSAASLMYLNGVRSTSLDEIGSAAGVGKSQIYHYFPDKAAVVRAVILQQTDNVLNAQEPYLSNLDSWTAWQTWRDLVVGFQIQTDFVGGCPLGSLASELSDSDEGSREELTISFGRWQQAFCVGLERMQQRGKLSPSADIEGLALATLTSLQGGLLLCQTFKDARPLEIALDSAITNMRRWAVTKKQS